MSADDREARRRLAAEVARAFGATDALAQADARLCRARAAARAGRRRGRGDRSPQRARGRSRHRRRQDLRLPRAAAAVRPACARQHGHQEPAGPAVPARPAAVARRAEGAGHPGAAEGARAATCACIGWSRRGSRRICPTASPCARWPRSSMVAATASGDLAELDGLDERSPVIPAGDVDARELPRQRVPAVPRLPRDEGAARRDGRGPRGRQPPSVLRRHGAARQRRGRAAAHGRRCRLRRGAPARRGRRAVSRHACSAAPGARSSRATCSPTGCSRRGACSRGRSWRPAATAPRATCGWLRPGRCATSAAPSSCGWDERAAADRFHRRPARPRSSMPVRPPPRPWTRSARSAPISRSWSSARASIAARAQGLRRPCADGHVRWIDLTPQQARLVESPLHIREMLSEQRAMAPKAWIFTSATLGDDDALSWFTSTTGLEDARTLRLGSPFDYAAHARLWVPRALPEAQRAGPSAGRGEARLALCGSAGRAHLRPHDHAARADTVLRRHCADELAARGTDIEVLVQGSAPKRALMQQFLARRCVRARGIPELLGRHRRAGRCAAVRDHRQAAVSAAQRPAGARRA